MTGRRRAGEFDALMERWARWLAAPAQGLSPGGQSLLARWMDAKGCLVFGGQGHGGPIDLVEYRIEEAAKVFGRDGQLAEDVLRLEYAAGWWVVAARRGWRGYDPRGLNQVQRAVWLGIGLRTYKARLAQARAFVAQQIKVKDGKSDSGSARRA